MDKWDSQTEGQMEGVKPIYLPHPQLRNDLPFAGPHRISFTTYSFIKMWNFIENSSWVASILVQEMIIQITHDGWYTFINELGHHCYL